VLGCCIEGIADKGRGDAEIRNNAITGLAMCEKTKGKKAQQRTIGVTGQSIDGIDERGRVDLPE